MYVTRVLIGSNRIPDRTGWHTIHANKVKCENKNGQQGQKIANPSRTLATSRGKRLQECVYNTPVRTDLMLQSSLEVVNYEDYFTGVVKCQVLS